MVYRDVLKRRDGGEGRRGERRWGGGGGQTER